MSTRSSARNRARRLGFAVGFADAFGTRRPAACPFTAYDLARTWHRARFAGQLAGQLAWWRRVTRPLLEGLQAVSATFAKLGRAMAECWRAITERDERKLLAPPSVAG